MSTELTSQSGFKKILVEFLKDPENPVLDFEALKKKGLLLSNLVGLQDINLWGCKFDKSSIPKRIENFRFETTDFSNLVYTGTLTFQDCVFGKSGNYSLGENDLEFKNFDIPGLFFISCHIHGRIVTLSKEIESLHFMDCTGNGELLFLSGIIKSVAIRSNLKNEDKLKSVTFKDASAIESIIIRDIRLDSIAFEGEICKDVFIGDGDYDNVNFNGSGSIGDFRIECSRQMNSFLKIGKLQLFRKYLEGDFQLNFIEIDKLFLNEIKGIDKSLSFRGVTVNNQFQFTRSTIERTFWNDVDFSKAELIFDYSFFKDLKYANIQWGKDFGISSKEEGVLRLKVLTEVYRQLKLNALNNQNGFDKLKLQRLENLRYWERVKQDKTERRTDRFLLQIDRLFSNFGQDYIRPVLWLLLVQLLLCSIIWCREDVYHHYNAISYCQAAENGFSQYLTMLIPIFKIPEYWTGMSISISIFIRLFNALMIYYFIRAVHKFGKN